MQFEILEHASNLSKNNFKLGTSVWNANSNIRNKVEGLNDQFEPNSKF